MNRATTSSFARWPVIAALAALAGCAQHSPVAQQSPQSTFRQTVETAPADLQLVCAGEAARIYEVSSDRVLPISSSAEGETFTVVLNADGTQAICTIDNHGNVLSLTRI
jgi:hypothetical protein